MLRIIQIKSAFFCLRITDQRIAIEWIAIYDEEKNYTNTVSLIVQWIELQQTHYRNYTKSLMTNLLLVMV